MVLLIGNYAPDQQQSMQRFAEMMLRELEALGVAAELRCPQPFFQRLVRATSPLAKWLGYVDKLLVFSGELQSVKADVVHICDHSNAVYAANASAPVLVTCHDLLAVRGGLGEETDCPASWSGRLLQRWILRGLKRARIVACVSKATANDAMRLVGETPARKITVVENGMNYPFRILPAEEAQQRLQKISQLDLGQPFVLLVGSALKRKNRAGALRAFALTKEKWNAQIVFAGEKLDHESRMLADALSLPSRIVEIENPDSVVLEALYNRAHALIFPSRFEGFGWPLIEAQACGCPVVCSDRAPMPEVAGDGALIRSLDDEAGFADDLLRLRESALRAEMRERGWRNAARFSAREMALRYLALYRELGLAA
ncbi:MAG: glycosyltransferase family 4 protein [Verrucomicrobiota bacterium]|nr:glycosyltransferase family 4 protein [Verrucomicrobiota bacterium]